MEDKDRHTEHEPGGTGNDGDKQAAGQERDNGEGQDAGARRKRATKLEAAKNKVVKHKNDVEAAEKNLHNARNATGYSKTEERRKADVQTAEIHLNCVKKQLAAAEQHLKDVIKEERSLQSPGEAGQGEEQTEQRRRDARRFSEDTLASIVQCKLMFEKHFNDPKKKNDQVWPDVLTSYKRMQACNEVPAEDTLTLEELKRCYHKELEFYRDYCKKVQREKTSGASCNDIDAITTRRSTQIFNQHGYMLRPMSQTPFSINGLNAHLGGEYSVFVEHGQQMQGVAKRPLWKTTRLSSMTTAPNASGASGGCASSNEVGESSLLNCSLPGSKVASGPVAKRRRGSQPVEGEAQRMAAQQEVSSSLREIASVMREHSDRAHQHAAPASHDAAHSTNAAIPA